jgi:hypothetical protein
MYAHTQQQGRRALAQVMEADIRQARFIEQYL